MFIEFFTFFPRKGCHWNGSTAPRLPEVESGRGICAELAIDSDFSDRKISPLTSLVGGEGCEPTERMVLC